MPHLSIVREEIATAALEALGDDRQSKVEMIANRTVAASRARGWEVYTWDEINALDDTVRVSKVRAGKTGEQE